VDILNTVSELNIELIMTFVVGGDELIMTFVVGGDEWNSFGYNSACFLALVP